MKQYKLKAAPAALTKEIESQKAPKAKRILVGIDTGLGSNDTSRKVDHAAIGPVQNLRSQSQPPTGPVGRRTKRLGAQGNALLLSQGFGSWKNWWRPQAFKALHPTKPPKEKPLKSA